MSIEEKKPLTWFLVVNLVLLFISGCWMIGSLMIITWRIPPKFVSHLLLITSALANISFLASLLASILGTANITQETGARRATVYAFVAGILFLMVSIIIFCSVVILYVPPYFGD